MKEVKRYFLSTLVVSLLAFTAYSQLTDDFEDGNFLSAPTWLGDDSVYTIVDVSGNKQLRSNKTIPSTSFYLATPSTQAQEGQWEFFTSLQFNTSSANFVDIYLTADQSNLMAANLNGYFVRIGGTTDEVSLFKKVNGIATKIIDGVDGITNTSVNNLKIKVTRTAGGDWKLERDATGLGSIYVQEGVINDVTLNTSSYFGVAVTQSTASFILKHFFDDFYVGPIILDVIPPQLVSAQAVGPMGVDVLFNEPLDVTSAELLTNYFFSPGLTVMPSQLDAVNPALVHVLLWSPGMTNGTTYQLTTSSIADVNGNVSGNQTISFTYLIAENPMPGDVIINEFMCDPSPTVGMPEVEYIEVYNKSSKFFDLSGWKIGDASSDGAIQSGWLYPGTYRILCATSNVDTFNTITGIGVTSFPSLNNTGDDIVLKDANGVELDRISYTDAWYKDINKADGGFSIERINPNDPCSAEDNWRATESSMGGTPELVNSVFDDTPDTAPPTISQLIALPPNYLEVHFSEGMDSTLLANANFMVNPLLNLQAVYVLGPHPTTVTLQYADNFEPSKTYQFFVENVADCWVNSASLSGVFSLPESAAPGDVVINEILFDPYTGGYDWIEVFNTSNKVIDLKDWQLANFDDDTIANFKNVNSHFYLQPNSYAVLGKDSAFVLQNYPAVVPGTFVYCETPSFNIDSSTVYLLQGNAVMDAVSYTEDWHFKLLDETDGVSLERIDPSGISNDSFNWHSAAEAIGFGTPGGKNSQYYPVVTNGEFHFNSLTVSPDSDGFEDVLQVSYELSEPGLLGTFTIYDDRGRAIRTLFQNELLASSGSFTWDGTTENQVKASIGPYVALFQAFNVDGGLYFTQKKTFVVAGKI
jgi:hypothetical protein